MVQTFTTNRTDWKNVSNDLFGKVISGAPFAVGLITREKGLFGYKLQYRLNADFPSKGGLEYIRKHFHDKAFEKVFATDEGLARHAVGGLYQVVGDQVGLPKNCLVARIDNPQEGHCKAVALFAGERLEGKLEQRLERLRAVLSHQTTVRRVEELDEKAMLEKLAKLDMKNLAQYKLDELSKIVNALDHVKDDIPKEVKPRYKTVSDFIIRMRTRGGVLKV